MEFLPSWEGKEDRVLWSAPRIGGRPTYHGTWLVRRREWVGGGANIIGENQISRRKQKPGGPVVILQITRPLCDAARRRKRKPVPTPSPLSSHSTPALASPSVVVPWQRQRSQSEPGEGDGLGGWLTPTVRESAGRQHDRRRRLPGPCLGLASQEGRA